MRRNKWLLWLISGILLSCTGGETPDGTVIPYKVAVVLPSAEKESLSHIVDWAQENIKAAQAGQDTRIELSLEWIDEDAPDMADKIALITHDRDYAAVIGPRYSRSARIIARESLSYRIPVLMPVTVKDGADLPVFADKLHIHGAGSYFKPFFRPAVRAGRHKHKVCLAQFPRQRNLLFAVLRDFHVRRPFRLHAGHAAGRRRASERVLRKAYFDIHRIRLERAE